MRLGANGESRSGPKYGTVRMVPFAGRMALHAPNISSIFVIAHGLYVLPLVVAAVRHAALIASSLIRMARLWRPIRIMTASARFGERVPSGALSTTTLP